MSVATQPKVHCAVEDGVATIRLVNGAGRNAVDAQMARELLAAVRAADADPAARVIVTVADGPVWCAGGDVAAFSAVGDGIADYIRAVGADVSAIAETLHMSAKITVAYVHGAVVGGGLGLMAAHDVVLAAPDTTFSFAYGALGLTPDFGGTAFVVRDLGYRRALDLYLSNVRLDAPAACELGLVTRVAEELGDLPARLAAGAVEAHGETKRLMRSGAELGAQLDDEIRTLARATTRTEFREGLAAFGERRRPDFRGAA